MKLIRSPNLLAAIWVVCLCQSPDLVQAKLGGSLTRGTVDNASNKNDPAENEQLNENLAEAFPHLHLRDEQGKRKLQRQLQELEMHGGNPDDEFIPLGLCEGDCDDDLQCETGLVCLQREKGDPVPGCIGEDASKSDYCIIDPSQRNPPPTDRPTRAPTRPPTNRPTRRPTNKPTNRPTPNPTPPPPTTKPPTQPPPTSGYVPVRASISVDLVGNNGMPPSKFPLQMCQGDCDSDEDCDTGLVCYLRSAGEAVPGCLGGAQDMSSVDFCNVDPNAPTQPAPSPTNPSSVPDISGPTRQNEEPLDVVGNNGWPAYRFPLKRCQGDCDKDSECATGLICHKPAPGASVPGCSGTPDNGDFCIVDPTFGKNPPPTDKPTNKPTKAPTSKPTRKPTRSPTPAPSNKPTRNPTYPPTRRPTPEPTQAPLQNIPVRVAKDFPLERCQGDCDADNDCSGSLICYQRQGSEGVPGCIGGAGDSSRTDYCILNPKITPNPTPNPTRYPTRRPTNRPTNKPTRRPTRNPTPNPTTSRPTNRPTKRPTPFPTYPPVTGPTPNPTGRPTNAPTKTGKPTPIPTRAPTLPPTNSPTRKPTNTPTLPPVPTQAPSPKPIPQPYHNVRMRLYWEDGYTWQESTKEKFWCMMADYRGKPGTGRCWHGQSTQTCSRDEMYIATCNNDKRQRFSIMFLNHDEVMIKVARDNRCFQRNGQLIQLRSCDPTNDLQRWFSRRGAFFQRRFELSNPSLPDYCATQEHHPKPGEQVYLEPCVLARHPYHQSNFWQRW